jgi:D-alanyl-D-alanine carboxypeptidase (penicillin-binding protein 5/6)
MFRRVTIIFLILFSLWQMVAVAAPPQPSVDAEAAVLMVANTRQVLFAKKGDGYMYPASTTKIMTLILALEKGDPNSIVTVSSEAAGTEGSSLDLQAGDKLTLKDMMNGMMMVSGNDAAEAIAENIAGSVPAFVDLMNAKAEKIGALKTHFINPHGLPDPVNHYTTAYDLALITAYGYQNPDFVKIVSTPRYNVTYRNQGQVRRDLATNTNKLLGKYPGANGVKTGFTNDAGECLVAGAKRGGVQLIAVVLNSEQRWSDASKLLDYGFKVVASQ